MPEGPEIIITSQYLRSKIRTKNIIDVKILGGRYTHQKLKGQDMLKNKPLRVQNVDSKGKFLWMSLVGSNGSTIYMMNTFGMTGRWSFTFSPSARIEFKVQSRSDKNKIHSMYYIDPRNFGTVEFTDSLSVLEKRIESLAPDILKSNLTDIALVKLLKDYTQKFKGNKNLVKTLMNQNAVVSGIGNYLVAEILYDSKINPHRSLDSLNANELKRLAHSMRKIPKIAYYDNTTGYMEHHQTFMNTHRIKIDNGTLPNFHPDIICNPNKSFKFKVYQQSSDPYNNPIKMDVIIKDRTIFWVPNVQK